MNPPYPPGTCFVFTSQIVSYLGNLASSRGCGGTVDIRDHAACSSCTRSGEQGRVQARGEQSSTLTCGRTGAESGLAKERASELHPQRDGGGGGAAAQAGYHDLGAHNNCNTSGGKQTMLDEWNQSLDRSMVEYKRRDKARTEYHTHRCKQ